MLLRLTSKRNNANMCSRTYWRAPFYCLLLLSSLLSGCEKSDDKFEAVSPEAEKSSVKQKEIKETHEIDVFAPTLKNERRGRWLGGPPPINKRASGIDTFYKIKATDVVNHLEVTLRFEGVEANDAKVEFRPIDGAKFLLLDQRSRWRLSPNTASQLTFTVVVPSGISYLAINTFQQNNGAARAIELKTH